MFKYLKITKIFVLAVVFFLFLTVVSNAFALEPLVPCGREGTPPCTTCDILVLGKNVSDFILFYLVPALATLFFIYAGFKILLGGGIPLHVHAGQNVFRTTVYGLMIIFLAWLIVNTVLRTVAGDSNVAENWWKLECKETIKVPPTTTTTTVATSSSTTTTTLVSTSSSTPIPSSTTTNRSTTTTTTVRSGTTTTVRSNTTTTTIRPTTTTQRTTTTTIRPSTTTTTTTTSTALACMFQGVNYSTFNICSGLRRPGGCGTSSCSQYVSSINRYANGAATANVLKAFMVIESDCNPTRVSYDGSSFGLMQFKPETAGDFTRNCGMGTQTSCTAAGGTWGSGGTGRCNVTGSWLTNPSNADKSICLAAAYINSLAARSEE